MGKWRLFKWDKRFIATKPQRETEREAQGTVTTDTLNVRSGAGTSYSIISKVYKGDTVNIVRKPQMDGTK